MSAIRALQQASVSLRVNGVSIFGVLDGDEVGVRVDLFPSAVEASWRAVEALVSPGVVVLGGLALVASVNISIDIEAILSTDYPHGASGHIKGASGATESASNAELLVGIVVLVGLASGVADAVQTVN